MNEFSGALDAYLLTGSGYWDDEEEEELPRKLPVIPANGRHVTTQQIEETLDEEE